MKTLERTRRKGVKRRDFNKKNPFLYTMAMTLYFTYY